MLLRFERRHAQRMISHQPQTPAPSPVLPKQRREVLAGISSDFSKVNAPQFQSSIFAFLWEKGKALVVVVVVMPSDSPGTYSVMGTQGFWLQAPQHFRCGSARPVGWLATEMPLHCRRQAWWCLHCFPRSLSLFITGHQRTTSQDKQYARPQRHEYTWDITTAFKEFTET